MIAVLDIVTSTLTESFLFHCGGAFCFKDGRDLPAYERHFALLMLNCRKGTGYLKRVEVNHIDVVFRCVSL